MIESRFLSATRLDETSLVLGRRSSAGAEPAPLRGSRGRPRPAPVILPELPTLSRPISRSASSGRPQNSFWRAFVKRCLEVIR